MNHDYKAEYLSNIQFKVVRYLHINALNANKIIIFSAYQNNFISFYQDTGSLLLKGINN